MVETLDCEAQVRFVNRGSILIAGPYLPLGMTVDSLMSLWGFNSAV